MFSLYQLQIQIRRDRFLYWRKQVLLLKIKFCKSPKIIKTRLFSLSWFSRSQTKNVKRTVFHKLKFLRKRKKKLDENKPWINMMNKRTLENSRYYYILTWRKLNLVLFKFDSKIYLFYTNRFYFYKSVYFMPFTSNLSYSCQTKSALK